ncbi:MAG: hypothetical protein LAT50_21825, partial [Ectothiorhodospiraceae bacterium]|nr:hypothetical protein [Ectothiorhodospiraceae bacterium]
GPMVMKKVVNAMIASSSIVLHPIVCQVIMGSADTDYIRRNGPGGSRGVDCRQCAPAGHVPDFVCTFAGFSLPQTETG